MFKNHPKGLFVVALSNMGERFGYYTMLSIFVLFLEARFGLSTKDMGFVWSAFLFCVYFLPLFGGILADKVGYGKIVTIGILLMIVGYTIMAIPGMDRTVLFTALFIIALGTGFFKGNLVVITGNLYDDPAYKQLRDSAFNIYYMFINVGAFFAPYAAIGMRNFFLGRDGFTYVKEIPGMANEFLKGQLTKVDEYTSIAQAQLGEGVSLNLAEFSQKYIDSLSMSYNAGFGVAAFSIFLSLFIFRLFRKYYKHADVVRSKNKTAEANVELSPKQTRDRIVALILVFFVVIFFWMAFHQNGYTLTLFAKNYTEGSVGPLTKVLFDLPAFLSIIGIIIGIVFLVGKKMKAYMKGIGAVLVIAGAIIAWWRYSGFTSENAITAELFQSFNPIFVVFLTPVVIAIFTSLARRNKEPSSPKKIGIGMLITAVGFGIMIFAAMGLASPASLESSGGVSSFLVSPYWLIGSYLTLTVAELFLSPMGLSFVAKVAPPKYRGLMQGGWLAATAIGNMLSGLIGVFYAKWELWQFFLMLVITSIISALFIFSILKRLERSTNS